MPGLFSPDVNFNIQPESPVAPVAAPTSFIEGALNLAGSFLQEEVRARRSSGGGSEGQADPNLAVFAEEVMKVESIRQDRGDAAAALAEKAVAQNFAAAGYDLNPSYQRVYSSITGREFKSYGVDPVEQARQQTLASPEAQTLVLKQSIMNPNGTPQEWEENALRKVNEFQANRFYLEQAKYQDQANFVTPSSRENGVVISNQQAFIQHADLMTSSAMEDLYALFKSGRRPTEGQVEEVSIAVNAEFGRLERPKGIADDQWAPIKKRRENLQEQIDRFKKVASNEELSSRFGRLLIQVIEQNPDLTPQEQALSVFGFLKGDQTVMAALLAGGNAERIALAIADPGVQNVVEGITPFFQNMEKTITPGDTGESVPNPDSPLVKAAQESAQNMSPQSAAKLLSASKYRMQPFKPENLSKPENSRDYAELAIQLGITIGANPDKSYLSSDFLRNTFNQDMWRNLEALQAYNGTYAAVAKTYLLDAVEKETARQNISIGSALRDSAFNIDDAGNISLDFSKIIGREGRFSKEDTDYFKEQLQKVYNNDLAEAVRTRFRRIPERRGTNVGVMRIVQELNLVDGYNQVSDRTKALQVLRDARIRLSTPEQQELSSAIRSGSSFEPTATLAQDELTAEDRRLNLKIRGFSNPDAINSSTVPEASQGLSAFDQKVQSLLESLPSFSLVGKANAATIESVVTAVPDVTSEEVTSAVDAIQAGTTLAEIQALGARQRAIMSSILNPVAPDQASTPTPRPRPDTAVAPATTSGITNVNEIARDPRTGEPIFPAQDELAVGVPESAGKEGVTDFLLDTLAKIESNNNPDAVSSAGAIGLYQIMENTAEKPGYGVKPLSTGRDIAAASPEEQRRFTRDYLNAMLKKFNGDLALALAAYNGGPGTVDKYLRGERDLPEETKNYVRKFARAGVVVGIAPKPPVPRPRPDTATATPTPRPRPRPDTATQSATSQRVSEALSRSESRTQGRKQLNEEALSEVKSEDKATSWLDSLTSTVAKTLFGSGVEFAELEDITKQAIRYANRNPIDFIYNSNLVGLDENNPDHQEAIAGFINRFVPGRVENPSEVEKDANAWCAAFAGHVLSNLGVAAPQGEGGFNALRAAQYKNLGKEVSREDAQSGDLVIIRNRTTGRHHVGFFVNSSDQGVAILGGNQNDQVNVTRYPNNRDYSFRRIDGMESISPEALKAVQSDISEFSGMSLTNLLHRII